jgi:hypothetical protein
MSGQYENGVSSITDVVKEAHELSLMRLELEAELALVTIETKAAHNAAAHALLPTLQAKATSHSFTRIALQARLLR